MDDAQDEALNHLANAAQMAKDSGLNRELDQAMPPQAVGERLSPSQLLERVLEYEGRIRAPQLTWVTLNAIELNHGMPLIELRKKTGAEARDLFIELLIERLLFLKEHDPEMLFRCMNISHEPTGEKPDWAEMGRKHREERCKEIGRGLQVQIPIGVTAVQPALNYPIWQKGKRVGYVEALEGDFMTLRITDQMLIDDLQTDAKKFGGRVSEQLSERVHNLPLDSFNRLFICPKAPGPSGEQQKKKAPDYEETKPKGEKPEPLSMGYCVDSPPDPPVAKAGGVRVQIPMFDRLRSRRPGNGCPIWRRGKRVGLVEGWDDDWMTLRITDIQTVNDLEQAAKTAGGRVSDWVSEWVHRDHTSEYNRLYIGEKDPWCESKAEKKAPDYAKAMSMLKGGDHKIQDLWDAAEAWIESLARDGEPEPFRSHAQKVKDVAKRMGVGICDILIKSIACLDPNCKLPIDGKDYEPEPKGEIQAKVLEPAWNVHMGCPLWWHDKKVGKVIGRTDEHLVLQIDDKELADEMREKLFNSQSTFTEELNDRVFNREYGDPKMIAISEKKPEAPSKTPDHDSRERAIELGIRSWFKRREETIGKKQAKEEMDEMLRVAAELYSGDKTGSTSSSSSIPGAVELLEEALTVIESLEKLGLKTVKAKMKELKVGDLKRRIKRYF